MTTLTDTEYDAQMQARIECKTRLLVTPRQLRKEDRALYPNLCRSRICSLCGHAKRLNTLMCPPCTRGFYEHDEDNTPTAQGILRLLRCTDLGRAIEGAKD